MQSNGIIIDMKKLTKKQIDKNIQTFTKAVKKYQRMFNLLDWRVVVNEQIKPDVRASCYTVNSGQIANICYSLSWVNNPETTAQELKTSAFHEIMELMLMNMRVLAEDRNMLRDEELVDKEVHKIIRILENTVFPLV